VYPTLRVTDEAGPRDLPNPAGGAALRVRPTVYAALAAGVLCLAALNLFFRLGQEFVTEWDEALYAISATEMLARGDWIKTTFFGNVDYYNTKPPLNIWLIAIMFKVAGTSIVSTRIASALSAFATVAALQEWTRRMFGQIEALLASLVLATTFGFLHIHAGRSANTDALFTLIVVLTVVVLWAEERQPWQRLWLGPLVAAAFLLRGLGVLMPLAIIGLVQLMRGRHGWYWLQSGIAALLCLIPVGLWAVARYRVDRWEFFSRMYSYDFLARSVTVIEEHPGGPLYYLRILVKHQYDWLFVAVIAAILFPLSRQRWRQALLDWSAGTSLKKLFAAWTVSTLLIPTLMLTKLPWYLNTFYPVLAIAVACLLVRGVRQSSATSANDWRLVTMCVAAIVAFTVAESKVWMYSYDFRDLSRSAQGLLLDQRDLFSGHQVFRDRFDRSTTFVGRLAGVELRYALTLQDFLRDSEPGDYLLISDYRSRRRLHPDLELVAANRGNELYRRREIRSRGRLQ
jgi:4-amino-4-deoxy-L-arabinose transferase-like glycosyltransferase